MEELVQMIREDPITRISPDFSYPQYPAVAPDRLKKYRELLTDIKMPLGITKSPQGTHVWFTASGSGLSISGSGKGYLYATRQPSRLVDCLDSYVPKDDHPTQTYRKISDNWYLWAD